MMGRLEQDQGQLFYSFCLEEVVPDDHQVRAIASVLDLSWVYGELSPHYPALGRPSFFTAIWHAQAQVPAACSLRVPRVLNLFSPRMPGGFQSLHRLLRQPHRT